MNELMQILHHELASPWFLVGVPPPPWIELQPMCRKAQFMPQAIHESLAFNSRDRRVAIHPRVIVKNTPYGWIDADASWIGFAVISRRHAAFSMNWIATNVSKAQFMPQAIHESTAFNLCNRKVAIHCVFSVKDNTLMQISFRFIGFYY